MKIINQLSVPVVLGINVSVTELRMEYLEAGATLTVDELAFPDVTIGVDVQLDQRIGPVVVTGFDAKLPPVCPHCGDYGTISEGIFTCPCGYEVTL